MPTTTRPGSGPRLPVEADLPGRKLQVLEGLAAIVGAMLLVVGVPLALLAAFGKPWPDQVPSLDLLSRPTSADTLLGVLAVVVWLAWLHFVVCLGVEAVAEIRHRGLAPSVPGGGIGTQYLARKVVVAIALLIGTSVATIGPVAAANAATATPTSPSLTSSVVATSASADQATPRQASGAGGSASADTQRASTLPRLGDLKEATQHDVAHGVTTYYRVQPPKGRHYDTMWDIADRYLGSGIRYKEIWELNKGLDQGDGRTLSNADLIQPNWVLRLPNDAKGPGLKVVAHAQPTTTGGSTLLGDAPSSAQGSSTTQADQVGQPAGAGVASGAEGGSGADAGPGVLEQALDGRWAPMFGIAGGLALSGAWVALRRRRSALTAPQLWAARGAGGGPDPEPLNPGGGRSSAEQLRGESDTSTAGWLDASLRSWQPGAGPTPARVSVGASGLAMAFDEGAPAETPAGWTRQGDHTWVLPRETPPTPGATGPAPLPGLVCVGRRSDDTLLLIDLESVDGIVAVDGAEAVARGLAMSVAVDTATHLWADERRVTLVGFADDLADVGPSLRRTENLGRALEAIENTARYQRSGCRAAGVASVREARVVAPDAQDWTYQLLVCSAVPDRDELARLRALASDPAVALGIVVVGSLPDAEMVLKAHADGRLSAPLHGIDVTAQVLDVRATRALSDLYEVSPGARPVSLVEVARTLADEGPLDVVRTASVHIGLLGNVTVAAPGPVGPARKPFLTELASFLALHPDGVHANRVAAAMWPRGVDDSVRDSALRQLVQWFGTTDDGRPVVVEEAGVWTLAPGAVEVDWNVFRLCLNAAADKPASRDSTLRSALSLVRGRPFADTESGRYAWLEGLGIERDMALAVSLTAQALAESAVSRRDAVAARSFLARGLVLLPASEELWRSWLNLESQLGSREELTGAIDEMYAAIAEHGSPLGASAQTDAVVEELVPGYRSRVA